MSQYKRRKNITHKQKIASIKSLSRRAAMARLRGRIEEARKLEDRRDGLAWQLEKEGRADDAYEAMSRGSSAGMNLYRGMKK